MTTNSKRAAWAAACVICVTTACNDIPLLPTWDSDWYLPIPSQAIALPVGVIPNGTPPQSVSFPPQQQDLDDAVGALLKQDLSNAQVIMTISKTVDLSGSDTLFIAAAAADLTNAGATRIVIPFTLTTADRTVVDTVALTAVGLGLLQSVADNDGTLHIQMRGTVQNNSGGTVTTTSADSIRVKLAMLATIAASK